MTSLRSRIALGSVALLTWFAPAATTPDLRAQQPVPPAGARATTTPPKLLVLLVVDQFRADYLDLYGAQWTEGLRRLTQEGALFSRATVPYAVSKTCAGHATISTGTSPATHGLIDNEWYDAGRRAFVACTADPSVRAVGLGGRTGSERHSATWLRAPTLGDELRGQAPQTSRVVALALKARTAIGLGGRGGPRAIVAWEEDSGVWASSTAYTRVPWPEVDAFAQTHSSASARGQVWNRLRPPASYRYDDRDVGEPLGSVFPHVLTAPPGTSLTAVWDASPWSDAYLGEMAGALVTTLNLGQSSGTDLLAIGFAALDYVGHAYGPRSHEVQDTLARLDVTIGQLLMTLDRTVGDGRYVVALTSDHGVAPLPEQAMAIAGTPGGRVNLNAIALGIEIALAPEFGRRPFVEMVTGTYVHFLPDMLDRIRASPTATRAVENAMRAVPGIERSYWSWELAATGPTEDDALALMRRSYVPGRSGDLAFLPRPYWVVASAGTNHGSRHPYDSQVPIALFGSGIRKGRYANAATIADVAPTLASLAGISMPRAEGRALIEALAR